MNKITFLGAGSSVFAKNVLGDVMLTPALHDATIALYDISETLYLLAGREDLIPKYSDE